MAIPRRQSSIAAEAAIRANITGHAPAPSDTSKASSTGAGRAAKKTSTTTAASSGPKTGLAVGKARGRKVKTDLNLAALGDDADEGEEGGKKQSKKQPTGAGAKKKAGAGSGAKSKTKAQEEARKEDVYPAGPAQHPLVHHHPDYNPFGKFRLNNMTGPGPTMAMHPYPFNTPPSTATRSSGQSLPYTPLGPLQPNMALKPHLRQHAGHHSALSQTLYHPAPAISPLRQQVYPDPSDTQRRPSLPFAASQPDPTDSGLQAAFIRPLSSAAARQPSMQTVKVLTTENTQLKERLAAAEGEIKRIRQPVKPAGNQRVIDSEAALSYIGMIGLVYNYMLAHNISGEVEFRIKHALHEFQRLETHFLNQKRALDNGAKPTFTIGSMDRINPGINQGTPFPAFNSGLQLDLATIQNGFEEARIDLIRAVRHTVVMAGVQSAAQFDSFNAAFGHLIAQQARYHRLGAWITGFHMSQTPTSASSGNTAMSQSSGATGGSQSGFIAPAQMPTTLQTRQWITGTAQIATATSGVMQQVPVIKRLTPPPVAAAVHIASADATSHRSASAPVSSDVAAAEPAITSELVQTPVPSPTAAHQEGDNVDELEFSPSPADIGETIEIAPAAEVEEGEAGGSSANSPAKTVTPASSDLSDNDNESGDEDDEFQTATYNMTPERNNIGVQELLASMDNRGEFGVESGHAFQGPFIGYHG